MQNKLHWAIHGQTAAEVIVSRADATKERMGLTTWKDAPKGKIQKFDVSVAKNYLTESEMEQLQRLVSAYLDVAEDMALREIPMTMQDWETRLNRFIAATDREILQDAGKVTAEALHQADKFIVDDIPLVEYFQKISLGRKNDRGEDNPEFPGGIPPVHSTIGDIVAGKKTARDSDSERIVAIPIGMAICDIALGHLTLAQAREKGIGQTFRLS